MTDMQTLISILITRRMSQVQEEKLERVLELVRIVETSLLEARQTLERLVQETEP